MNILDIIIVFLCILFKYLIVYNTSSSILYLLLAIICVLAVIDIFYLKLKKETFFKILLFFGISCYFLIISFDANFLISFVLSLILIKKKEKDYIKTFMISSIILFIFTVSLNIFGILESTNIIRYKYGEKIIRYSLGFEHPNSVFLFFLPIALCGYYLYGNKKTYYFFLTLFSLILYFLSDSRTGIICMLLIILFDKILNKKVLENKAFKFFCNNSILIFSLITIIISCIFGDDLTNKVSSLFSGRPYYLNYYVTNGQIFSLVGAELHPKYIVDNFYIYVLARLGLIGFSVYYFTYKLGMKKLGYSKVYAVLLIITCIYGILETNMIIGSINFLFPILIRNIIDDRKDKI